MTIKFTTPIRELVQEGIISPRSHNTCLANGIDNVRDLDYYYQTDKGFMGFRNCGIKTNNELEEVLRQAHSGDISECAHSYVGSLPPELVEILKGSIAERIPDTSDLPESRRFHTLFTPETFIYLCYREREQILRRATSTNPTEENRKVSAMEQYALRKAILGVISLAIEKLSSNFDATIRRERTMLKRMRNSMENSLRTDYVADYYAAMLSSRKMRLAEREYARLVVGLPKIVQNFIRKYELSLDAVWPLLNISEEEFLRRFPTSRKGALGFQAMLADFKKYVDNLTSTSDEEDNREELKMMFPFLTDEDAEKSATFRKEFGHLPMFYITDRYFATTTSRQHRIFACCFGLGGNSSKRKTEVADDLGVSRERVRQIISDTDFSKFPFADHRLWEAYPIISSEFVSYKSHGWKETLLREGLPPVFTALAGVMVGIHGYLFKRMAGVDKFIVRPDRIERYAGYLKQMLDLRDRTHVEDKVVAISEILTPQDYSDYRMRETLLTEFAGYLDLEVLGETLFFPHNSVDVAAEVENILRKEGNPLHIDEILSRMNLMFPDLGLTKDRLKFQMRSSDEIVPKGKTSLYCLQSWTHIFIGSIRDLVKHILTESEVPLDMAEIMRVVQENFDTTRYNVYNSLLICDDFALYEGSRFGLSGKEYPAEYKIVSRNNTRKSFAERFADYKEFVARTGHHPYNSGEEEEETLKRWQVNVLKDLITVLPGEREMLTGFIETTDKLPFSSLEHSFKRNCEAYLDYMKRYGCAPTSQSEPELLKWYRKQMKCYEGYSDRRRLYFEQLLEEISKQESGLFRP